LSDSRVKLQQLLDGELDPSEIANDPTLSRLAERIYGMDIKALLAEKGISAPTNEQMAPVATGTAAGPMVEVIPEAASPMANLPPPAPMPEMSAATRKPLFIIVGVVILALTIFNLLIGIGELFNPCSTDWCSQNLKFNWLSPHQVSSDSAWGAVGTAGIPDYAMIAGASVLTLLGLRKKA